MKHTIDAAVMERVRDALVAAKNTLPMMQHQPNGTYIDHPVIVIVKEAIALLNPAQGDIDKWDGVDVDDLDRVHATVRSKASQEELRAKFVILGRG